MLGGQDSLIERLYSLTGKTAVVTGGSRGIGSMIAKGLLGADAKVYIVSRKADDCVRTASELSKYGECFPLPFDLLGMEGIKGFADAFSAREDRLDILVNNAGAAWGAPLEDYPESGWDKVVDLNLKSPFFLIQKLLPLLERAGSREDPARIINIASVNGITHPHDSNYAYSASKAAVIQLTKHLAGDLAKDNINVNAVAPGYFMTKMMAHADADELVRLSTAE